KVNKQSVADPSHISEVLPEAALTYGDLLWMDPGSEAVRGWFVDVIADVVTNYDIDGVHFDDYFYPYPNGAPFPDDATWAAYQQQGGVLARDDWRRDNVNRLVEDVSTTISALRPDVRFGISPFGIYRPGIPEGITGLDQYGELFSDPPVWIEQGWVDYLAPQLYWPSTQTAQAYGPLIAWWSTLTAEGQGYVFAGNYLAKVGSEPKWSVDEFLTEVELSREQRPGGSFGNIFYHIDPLMHDTEGVAQALLEGPYAERVLTPVVAAHRDEVIPYPGVVATGSEVLLSPPEGLMASDLRAYTIYTFGEGEWTLREVVGGETEAIELPVVKTAVAAVDRRGVESLGVVVNP
ncbi:MAG: glycoside hydrolase family 10 protein, partial [Nannocystaceae bacterium]